MPDGRACERVKAEAAAPTAQARARGPRERLESTRGAAMFSPEASTTPARGRPDQDLRAHARCCAARRRRLRERRERACEAPAPPFGDGDARPAARSFPARGARAASAPRRAFNGAPSLVASKESAALSASISNQLPSHAAAPPNFSRLERVALEARARPARDVATTTARAWRGQARQLAAEARPGGRVGGVERAQATRARHGRSRPRTR